MSRAWTFQDGRQKKKHGAKAPWSVGYFDPDGIKRSKRVGSKSMAEKVRRKMEGELAAGTYQSESRKSWKDFRAEYEEKIAAGMEVGTRNETLNALKHFERIIKPARLLAIKTRTIDAYVSRRRIEPGRKRGSKVSPATVNKELRHIKAVLRVATEWKYLPEMPKIRMLKEPVKLATYVTPEHFAAIYQACDAAKYPRGCHYPAADWWRAFLTYQYMTGWRMGEPLALRWDDVSLDAGEAITRHADNKAKRDERVPLHPVVVDHLRKLVDFGPVVFTWPHHETFLYVQFRRIQQAAEIHLPCHEKHEHTPSCYVYGFHDLRRAFATMNADRLTGDALQALMRHKSYSTTQRYIAMARQLDKAVEILHVPDVLKKAAGGS